MLKKIAILASLGFCLAACAADRRPMPEPMLTDVNAVEPEPVNNPASLYEAGESDFLFDDNRANKVGDIVLISVSEVTTGEHKENTTASKENDTNLGVSAMPSVGLLGAAGKAINVQAGTQLTSGSSSKFTSTGDTKHETTLTTTVAARIIRILPGKVMQVEGARQIRINAENQIIVVRGLIRQRDINARNTVPSSALADAKIEVYGQGMLSDKQRGGWLSRLLDNLWPF